MPNATVKRRIGPEPRIFTSCPLPDRLVNATILIKKNERRLELYSNDQIVRTYKIGLGNTPVGDKEKEGDGRTPEGDFYVTHKNPSSNYYLSLGISYPNSEDAARGLRTGVITRDEHDQILQAIAKRQLPLQKTALGGEIFIHGHGSKSDWTLGCVALDDADVKELFDIIEIGTPVVIKP